MAVDGARSVFDETNQIPSSETLSAVVNRSGRSSTLVVATAVSAGVMHELLSDFGPSTSRREQKVGELRKACACISFRDIRRQRGDAIGERAHIGDTHGIRKEREHRRVVR